MATESENQVWEYIVKNLSLDEFRRMQQLFAPIEEDEYNGQTLYRDNGHLYI